MKMEQLQPKVKDIGLWADGKNLKMQFYDLAGIDSEITMWEHRMGNFGEISFKGITKEFVTDLANKLIEAINKMPDAEKVEADAD